jgi:hypothetical protein
MGERLALEILKYFQGICFVEKFKKFTALYYVIKMLAKIYTNASIVLIWINSTCVHAVRDQKMLTQPSYAGRVSFIGHSVGGLIIRKCLEVSRRLKNLAQFLKYVIICVRSLCNRLHMCAYAVV